MNEAIKKWKDEVRSERNFLEDLCREFEKEYREKGHSLELQVSIIVYGTHWEIKGKIDNRPVSPLALFRRELIQRAIQYPEPDEGAKREIEKEIRGKIDAQLPLLPWDPIQAWEQNLQAFQQAFYVRLPSLQEQLKRVSLPYYEYVQNMQLITDGLNRVYWSYISHLQYAVKEFSESIVRPLRALFIAYQNLIISSSLFLEEAGISPISPPTTEPTLPEIDQKIENELNNRLEELHPDFLGIRKGAWQTFYSNNPDKLRQAMSSMRELFNQVLHKLAPDKGTRKERLKAIISSGVLEEVIDSFGGFIDRLYGMNSKIVHTKFKDEGSVCAFLKMTELVIYVILINREALPPH